MNLQKRRTEAGMVCQNSLLIRICEDNQRHSKQFSWTPLYELGEPRLEEKGRKLISIPLRCEKVLLMRKNQK